MNLPNEINDKVKYWSQSETFDSSTHREIENLIQDGNEKEIIDRFYRDLEFGTGGMRGLMGAGSSRINIYNIRRATQALSLYLKELYPHQSVQIAISYDSRNNSRLYAEAAAEVLAANNIRSLITKNMRPVPMLSFMVRHFQCQAGICITASHNPAPYNGYKVYWNCGGQLIPPHDRNISNFYSKLSDYSKLRFFPFARACQERLITEIGDELDNAYFDKLKSLSFFSGARNLKIVYSPLHGTGIYALPQALKNFGFHEISIVHEQAQPDGNFPTVASPNPEDSRSLELALKLGATLKADIVLATDPDADRLAVVVREEDKWQSFSGNQMGALLFEYVLANLKTSKRLPKDGFTIKTVVTSDLLKDISNYHGLPCEETLTGFKWICHLVDNYETGKLKPYKQFLCGAEESYGFLAGTFVRDKDAVLSAVIATEMLAYYRHLGRTLSDVLDELYMRHGFYSERLETITLPGKDGDEKIKSIMKFLRNSPPLKIGELDVDFIKDYSDCKIMKRVGTQFQPHASIALPESDVLQYLSDDVTLTIRPSGTEPKIKVYLSTKTATESIPRVELSNLKKHASERTDRVLSDFLALVSSL